MECLQLHFCGTFVASHMIFSRAVVGIVLCPVRCQRDTTRKIEDNNRASKTNSQSISLISFSVIKMYSEQSDFRVLLLSQAIDLCPLASPPNRHKKKKKNYPPSSDCPELKKDSFAKR